MKFTCYMKENYEKMLICYIKCFKFKSFFFLLLLLCKLSQSGQYMLLSLVKRGEKCGQTSPETIGDDTTQDRIRGKHRRFGAGWLCVSVCAPVCT